MSKLTVIVTVHNNEEYLRRCLGSIITQDYEDFEIYMIMDEGSTDKSLEICEEYLIGSPIVKLTLEIIEPCWVGVARNYAANKVKSKYITFVDGDDSIPQGSLKKMMWIAEKNDSDCVYGKTTMVYPNGKTKVWDGILTGDNKSYVAKTFLHPVIYDRELYINHLKCLENIKTHEDRLSGYLITKFARNPIYLDRELYNYHVNPGSSIRRKDIRIKMLDDLEVVLKELDKYDLTKDEKKIILNDMLWSAITCLVYIMNEEHASTYIIQWLATMNKYIPEWRDYPNTKRIMKNKYIFRSLLKIMIDSKTMPEAIERFIIFPEWKKTLINTMSEVMVYGGVINYIKLSRRRN